MERTASAMLGLSYWKCMREKERGGFVLTSGFWDPICSLGFALLEFQLHTVSS